MSHLLHALQCHKPIRIAAVCAIVAWLLTQLAGEISPAFAAAQNSSAMRLTVAVNEDTDLSLGGIVSSNWGLPVTNSLALSSDGSFLVYSAWEQGADGRVNSQLYLRRLDQERADPVADIPIGSTFFLSPDDKWIAYFYRGSLLRVSVTGGNVETIFAGPGAGLPRGASWGDNGNIIYAARDGSLYQVAASGGDPELVADPNSSTNQLSSFAQPHLLPGSELLLFHGLPRNNDPERAEIIAMNLNDGSHTSLLTNAMSPHYVANTGHLLFMRQGSLMAVKFDPDRLVLTGEPVTVQEDVMHAVGMPSNNAETGAVQMAISSSGVLAYVSGGVYPELRKQMVRISADGSVEPIDSAPVANYVALSMSPEGDRVAYTEGHGKGRSIHIHEFDSGVTRQLDTGGFYNGWPTWSPDGKFIAFTSDREDDTRNVYRLAADGSDEQPRRLLPPSEQNQYLSSWSSQGDIAYLKGGDIWVLPANAEPRPFFTSDTAESHANFSPDGRWLAYVSRSGGRSEIYVRPYPGPGPATLISDNGYASPSWSPDGTQIYFFPLDRSLARSVLMVVDFVPDVPSQSRPLIDPWVYGWSTPAGRQDVLADGAFITSALESNIVASEEWTEIVLRQLRVSEIQIVLNFFEILRQRVGD